MIAPGADGGGSGGGSGGSGGSGGNGHDAAGAVCSRCGRPLSGDAGFVLGGQPRCWRCAIRHRPLLRRSTQTALVVGTILVLINQGTDLAAGRFPEALLWKVPLTYLVPFLVASWGALSNSRRSPSPRAAGSAAVAPPAPATATGSSRKLPRGGPQPEAPSR